MDDKPFVRCSKMYPWDTVTHHATEECVVVAVVGGGVVVVVVVVVGFFSQSGALPVIKTPIAAAGIGDAR